MSNGVAPITIDKLFNRKNQRVKIVYWCHMIIHQLLYTQAVNLHNQPANTMIPSHYQALIQPPEFSYCNWAASNIYFEATNPSATVITKKPTSIRSTRMLTSTIRVKFAPRPVRKRPAYPLFHFVATLAQRRRIDKLNLFCPYNNILNHVVIVNRDEIELELVPPISEAPNSNPKNSLQSKLLIRTQLQFKLCIIQSLSVKA